MSESPEILKFFMFFPIVSETMPEQIYVQNESDGMIFIAKSDSDIAYQWNIYDEYPRLRYKMYSMNILKDNEFGDVVFRCFLPTELVSKVGLHQSYWSPYFAFINLTCNFKASSKFDHNTIDFTPKVSINDTEKIKVFIYRPTFTETKQEINCICYIEY